VPAAAILTIVPASPTTKAIPKTKRLPFVVPEFLKQLYLDLLNFE
jgi:hypothetical protein